MAYLGRYLVGDTVPLFLQTTDAQGNPAAPDKAPLARVFDPTATMIVSFPLPPMDRYGVNPNTSLFMYPMPLLWAPIVPIPGTTATVAKYATISGMYCVLFSWSIGAFTGHSSDSFEIGPGGEDVSTPIGVLTSMAFYPRPHADFIVAVTDGGTLRAGQNPRLSQ